MLSRREGRDNIALLPAIVLSNMMVYKYIARLDKPDFTLKFVETSITMGAANLLDRQINDYLVLLNTRQKKAILNVAKTFVEEKENNLWGDDEFIAELDRRTAEYEGGNAKVLTLNELENRVRKAYKAKRKK